MLRLTPRSTLTDTPFPYPTLFRSHRNRGGADRDRPRDGPRRLRRVRNGERFETRVERVSVDGRFEPRNRAAGHLRRAPVDRQGIAARGTRSEEHTSELQSLMRISYAVFCLKKKKSTNKYKST